MNASSYTAASTIPSKLFCNMELFESIREKRIIPIHLQLNPTNKCPLNCSFCSCKNRDKNLEIDYDLLMTSLSNFIQLGTKAVTITGGGDPLAYERLGDLINYLYNEDIKIGFVTNGVLFKDEHMDLFNKVTWCRISLSDEYNLLTPKISKIVEATSTDWSFSYVLKPGTEIKKVADAISFANQHKFTHVRLVDDILSESGQSVVDQMKKNIRFMVDDRIVIYQGRKTYTHGHKRCLISLLKPNIGPDGKIYPCCGIQYAKDPPSYDLKDSMGDLEDLEKIWNEQLNYDGSDCVKCYYSDYNNILNIIEDAPNLKHKEFV
jgi:MoaA/NifB/PqqE/SkfB family radical SAM enzyme